MEHKLFRFHSDSFVWHRVLLEIGLVIFLLVFVWVTEPVSAAMRLQNRSLYMNTTAPGATTFYKVSFQYMSPVPVGSVDMLFCVDPIPHHPCEVPPGLDVSNAVLAEQLGEAGYVISQRSTNHLVLSRTPQPILSSGSSYKLDNVINPSTDDYSFSIRLRTHSTSDASGPQVDFGSVKGQATQGVTLQTQVPPMLIFCLAAEVEENCSATSDVSYADMGTLSDRDTLTAQSQMAVGTNASGGFAITANGPTMSAGTNVIEPLAVPTESRQGVNQFGINLVANNAPTVGGNPEGTWANAIPSPEYSVPNRYKYRPGDVVAYSPNVSLMKKFTVSYVVNSKPDLKPGVYTTTITYIASGRF